MAVKNGNAALAVDIRCGDCLDILRTLPDGAADFCFTSPPYEDCRTYGIDFKAKGQAWVDWMIPRVVELCRVTNGLVLVNAAGKVRKFRYSPVVEWLAADLTRLHGIVCGPAPYVFHRVGIPGSGGPHYHRRDWEPIYAFALPENLPPKWSDNTAMGHPPKWAPGGEMSYRVSDGSRINQWGHGGDGPTANARKKDGTRDTAVRPSLKRFPAGKREHTKSRADGSDEIQFYQPPKLANPGNVIKVTVGGGQMGDDFAHENEAPFPESLVEWFIRSYCPPCGTAIDPFAGSGTVAKVCKRLGRNSISIDVRGSQCDLIRRRLASVQRELIA